MASKQVAVILQKRFGRIGTVLIYAFLEWVLIFLLMMSALLSYLTTKFAHYFGLHPPCLWCNRLDRVLGKEGPGFYRSLVCDLHAREISCLGYCHAHKHLADVQGMCENCLLCFAEEDNKKKPSLCTYKELGVGLDGEGNKEAENEDGGGFLDKKDEIHANSNNESDLITGGICSCCKAPLKRSRVLLQKLMRVSGNPVIAGARIDAPNSNPRFYPKPVVDFDVGLDSDKEHVSVDSDKEQTPMVIRSVDYPSPTCNSVDMSVAEDADEGDLKWNSLGHIGYTELKVTSDSGSDISVGDDGLEFGGQDQDSQVELISHNLVQGLDHYMISAANNPFLDPDLEMTVLESIVETHQNPNHLLKEFSQTILVGEDSRTVAMLSSDDSGKHQEVCGLTETELAQKTVEVISSSSLEEIATGSYEQVNEEISPSEGCGIGECELENNRISDNDHSQVLPAEFTCYSKDIVQDNEVCSGTQVPKPIEEKELSSQSESSQESQQIEAKVRKDETNAINVTVFRGEEANRPQQEVKLSPGFFPTRELFRTDFQNSYSAVVGMSTAEDYRTPETPRFIEGLHMLHKRVSIDRNDSGFDSLDGSILSEIEGEGAVDRLKRQLELERKSLNTLYSELEAERNASAIAANQAMAMITRLQEEKAAMQMEALQYQRMMEEQAEYDQEALQLLNEVLAKREKEIKDLEMEVEMYRKRFRYEAIKERKDKRIKNSCEKTGAHLERKRNLHNHLSNDQYEKVGSSSMSSLNEDTDESSSSHHETGDICLQQNNHITPVELTMNESGVYEEQQLEDSFYESIVDLEEERLSILERLKSLEERLHIFADDGESDVGKPPKTNSNIVMVHPEENVEPQKYSEAMIEENRSSCLGTGDDASNGNGEPVPMQRKSGICNDLTQIRWKESQKTLNIGNVDPSAESMACTARKSGFLKGKKLLPLFEAISFEEESYDTEASHIIGQSNDWCSTSMIVRDNTRLAIEEEMHDLNERLQALEADREFIRHSIKSLKKGDEGMKLLQEISQHLRELRKLDMRASSFNDPFVQEDAVFDPSLERNGTITIQPNYCIS